MRAMKTAAKQERRSGVQSMAPASQDPKVLNFGDVTLRRSDVDRLEQPEELNDQIIEFFFEHLTAQLRERGVLLLVGPSQTYWLLHCPPEILQESLKSMSLPERQVYIPCASRVASSCIISFQIGRCQLEFHLGF